MKVFISYFILGIVAIQFIACKKDATQPSTTLPLTASNIAGNFTVGSFINSGNQTAVFSGFTFMFRENGTVIATKGNDTFNGSWVFDDSDHTEIKISFSDDPLNQLNKHWHITSLTEDHLLLTGDSESEDANDDHTTGGSSIEFERD